MNTKAALHRNAGRSSSSLTLSFYLPSSPQICSLPLSSFFLHPFPLYSSFFLSSSSFFLFLRLSFTCSLFSLCSSFSLLPFSSTLSLSFALFCSFSSSPISFCPSFSFPSFSPSFPFPTLASLCSENGRLLSSLVNNSFDRGRRNARMIGRPADRRAPGPKE